MCSDTEKGTRTGYCAQRIDDGSMKNTTTILALIATALTPTAVALWLFQGSITQATLLLTAAIISALLAWLLINKQLIKKGDQPSIFQATSNPGKRAKLLLNPTYEFLTELNDAGTEEAVIKKNTRALSAELNNLRKKLDWVNLERSTHEATVLISDLRGFTTLSETYTADEVVDLLNRYFEHMCRIIYKHGGTIDKLIGDSIMAVFGSPESSKKNVMNALSCAAEMQITMNKFNRENQTIGMPALYMGIGLNTGEVVASNIGSEIYNEYTVIGSNVNLAARIESSTVRGQILIGESTFQRSKNYIKVSEPMQVIVKGKREAVSMYELLSVTKPRELIVPEREIRRMPRVDVNIPFKFHVCEGKIITSEEYVGQISNISTGGMLAYTDHEIDPYFFIRFTLDFNVLGMEGNDIYGKILKVTKKEAGYEINIEFTIIDPEDRHAIQDLVNNTLAGMQQWKQNKV